jgi:peptidyl-tRNA hydrolase, PTH1 family
MYTIVGLGNHGFEYEKTRHNAGRLMVEALAATYTITLKPYTKPPRLMGVGTLFDTRVRLLIPDTFMNTSGKAVLQHVGNSAAAKKLIVIYDEIDLPFGSVRVSFGSSSGGHNGIRSIERSIKTKNFIKIRVGVSKKGARGAKKPRGEEAVIAHLLGKFTKGEYEKLMGPLYDRVSLAVENILESRDPVVAMNAVNGLPLI